MNQIKLVKNYVWLIILAVSVLLASAIFYVSQLLSVSNENLRTAQIFQQSLSAAIEQYEYLPALIAKDTDILNLLASPSQDHRPISDKLAFAASRSGASNLFVLDINGNVIATSNYQDERSFYNKNYAFRPYFIKAKSQQARQFYFAKGATTGIPGFFISEPIIENNRVLGVVVVKLELLDWESSWRDSDDVVLVSDDNGVVIISAFEQWRYALVKDIGEAQLNIIKANKQFPDEAHEVLFSQARDIRYLQNTNSQFWTIENKIYLVNSFAIAGTDWTLHKLTDKKFIFYNISYFITIASLIAFFIYLFLQERTKKIMFIQRATQMEVQRSQDLQALIDTIQIGVFVFNQKGNVISMNQHAKALLFGERTAQQAHEIHIQDIVDIDLQAKNLFAMQQASSAVAHPTNGTAEHNANSYSEIYSETSARQIGQDGAASKIDVMYSLSRVNYAGQDSILMTLVNIQRRKQAELEIKQLNESLEETVKLRTDELKTAQQKLMQKNKAAALGNMAATIVHELSQPLTAINSSIAAIESKTQQQDWQGAKSSFERLLPLSQKMHEVIRLLKYFSYDDAENNEAAVVCDVLQSALTELQPILDSRCVKLTVKNIEQSVLLAISPLKLNLVLSNLIRNAIDAVANVVEPEISISSEKKNKTLRLQVEDNGGGVDNGIMGKLFNPYFTTKEVGKGMGLGLSIVYEILQQYNGKISAVNTKQGARFTIELPIEALHTPSKQQKTNSNN